MQNYPPIQNYPPAQANAPIIERGVFRPEWLEQLVSDYAAFVARQFILHFNIDDFAFDMDKRVDGVRQGDAVEVPTTPLTTREYLHYFLYNAIGVGTVYTFSMANGVTLSNPYTHEVDVPLSPDNGAPLPHRRFFSALHTAREESQRWQSGNGGGREQDNPDLDSLKALGYLLRNAEFLEEKGQSQSQGAEPPIAVIVDYAEKILPYQLGEGHGDRRQMQMMEVVQRWALDPEIARSKNINILFARNIGLIPKTLYSDGSGCNAIRVPLPNEHERLAYLNYLHTRERRRMAALIGFDGNVESYLPQMARLTQGMRLRDIENAVRRALVGAAPGAGATLTRDDVQREKSNVMTSQSENLLEILSPDRGFEEIGGLQSVKDYLTEKKNLMLNDPQSPQIPTALLLAGPPGTGKTIIAEALAKASGFNLVKMRNIRDKWVGSSERNLDLVFSLLQDLYPVVVFIDEVDQAIGQRETSSNDSGVSARMFGRVLEEMSNSRNRGKILWVAATNRVDLLDDAMLRRFDRIIPLLVPAVDESCRIFATMLKMVAKQSGKELNVAYGGDLDQSNPQEREEDKLKKFIPIARLTTAQGITGAGIEVIVRRAIEMAAGSTRSGTPVSITGVTLRAALEDYLPNHDRDVYDWQSLVALNRCNFRSVIPDLPHEGVYARITGKDGRIVPQSLQQEIERLQQIIYDRKRTARF
ncbi:MAG TPA: ATP-binding protein [Ktedonobacterales bacterium]|jgi:SpoVK/Ycf46/Vps4 family AAA+-type ATPase